MKLRTADAAITLTEIGATMRMRIWIVLAPSTRAASSISSGSSAIEVASSTRTSGRFTRHWMNPMPIRVSSRSTCWYMR